MKNIAIIGSGTWGVALAIHLSKKGNKIKIWSFSEEEANTLNTERKCKFLPEAVIDENITCYTDMKTVIEGVETEEQFNTLSEIGCDYFQGYYFSKPVPLDELKKALSCDRTGTGDNF